MQDRQEDLFFLKWRGNQNKNARSRNFIPIQMQGRSEYFILFDMPRQPTQ